MKFNFFYLQQEQGKKSSVVSLFREKLFIRSSWNFFDF